MGVTTTTTTTVICDKCEKPVNTSWEWVDAGYWGVAFHATCFNSMTCRDWHNIANERGHEVFIKRDGKEPFELKHSPNWMLG